MGDYQEDWREECGKYEAWLAEERRARDKRVEGLKARLAEVVGLLSEAHPHVCSLLCPSVWKTGEDQPHVELCRRLAAAQPEEESRGLPRA